MPPAPHRSSPHGPADTAYRRARHNARRRGTAATQFAIIAFPLFVLLMGVMEAAWQLATGAGLDHAALRASRYGMTGANTPPSWQTQGQGQNLPTCRSNNIRWLITRSTGWLIRDNSDLTITTAAWAGVNGAGSGNGTSGAGAGGQIVSYTITYRQPFVTGGIARLLWGTDGFTHRAFLMVKNEPFDNVPC